MYRALLNGPDDFDGWRDAARRCPAVDDEGKRP